MNSIEHAEKLAKLINIKTVSNQFERDEKTFKEFFNIVKELFPNLFKVSDAHPFEGGFYLVYKGKNHDHPILFMNHHDVVDANGKWDTDPFHAVIKDGKIYGRGVLDTKGGLYCMLEAADSLAKEGFVPEQDIYLLSDNNEETNGSGGEYISSYFKEHDIRFRYVLDEGGLITPSPMSFAQGDFAMVAVGEKPIMEIKFTAKSKGGHSSMPPKNSPLIRLSRFMLAVERSHKFNLKIHEVTKEMLKSYGNNAKGIYALILKHPTFFYPLLLGILPSVSPLTRAMLRTTIAFTYAKASESYNVMPTEASVVANIRVASHQSIDDVIQILQFYCDKYDLELEVLYRSCPCMVSSHKTTAFEDIKRIIKEEYPSATVSPYIANTASDARFFSKVSNTVYGFVPFLANSQQVASIHGDNESLDIDCLPKAVNFYQKLMRLN